MEVKNTINKVTSVFKRYWQYIKYIFIKKSEVSDKKELNLKSFKNLIIWGIILFVLATLLIPTEQEIVFTTKIVTVAQEQTKSVDSDSSIGGSNLAARVWNNNSVKSLGSIGGNVSGGQVNYNTSMLLGAKNTNAKTQLRAGVRLPLRIIDKFIVSEDPVPILAELILDSETDSGLKLPMGTRVYGVASFQRGAERATVSFKQISLPSGEIKPISGVALGKDGETGISGNIHSDRIKNTSGSIITTFIAGYATGSMETNVLGQSKGGVDNGIRGAIAATAKDQAQSYGEKLKTQREWIEVLAGTECDALLSESMNLQNEGGDQ